MSSLPVILISAKSTAEAVHFMSELTGADGAEEREWRIANKYYAADVVLAADPDGGPARAAPDAHVLLLGAGELAPEEAARRAARGRGAAVRVLCAAAPTVPPALLAWCAAARYEPVALLERAPPDEGPTGAAAARAALHAHAWPGLRRAPEPRDPLPESLEALAAGAAAVRALPRPERLAAAEALLGRLARALDADLDDL